jgi:hypothetical protein
MQQDHSISSECGFLQRRRGYVPAQAVSFDEDQTRLLGEPSSIDSLGLSFDFVRLFHILVFVYTPASYSIFGIAWACLL